MSTEQERAAATAVELAATVVDTAGSHLANASLADGKLSVAKLDEHQVIAYDLAHAAAAVEAARVMCRYAKYGEVESMLARAYVADAVVDIVGRLIGREGLWGVDPAVLADLLIPALPQASSRRCAPILDR